MELGAEIILLSSLLIGADTWATTAGVVGSCDAFYTASSGVFASPGYPNNYPNYSDCKWRISSGGGKNIRLTFTYINVEADSRCRYDGIHVYDGPSTSSPLMETVCGSTTRTFFSRGSDLTVVFFSDGDNTGQGFVASWVFEEASTEPTEAPTWWPTEAPTEPTEAPTWWPTEAPTEPTEASTWWPTEAPTEPTEAPTWWPTEAPTEPTEAPTWWPTEAPTETTDAATELTEAPTWWPTEAPTEPTEAPTWWPTEAPTETTDAPTEFTEAPTPLFTLASSCRWNCGYFLNNCSCSSSCQYYGNCCPDYYDHCHNTPATTDFPTTRVNTTETAAHTSAGFYSCRGHCGTGFGSCYCDQACTSAGDCCPDYYEYCSHMTDHTTTPPPTTDMHLSCMWNCGYNLSSCSCDRSCEYYGNCCYDYYWHCPYTTQEPHVTASGCGGSLFGSGSLSSPNHPNYYHDNSYCVWQLSGAAGERVFLSFVDLELENCCGCDYINVYDGSTTSSPLLGKLCFNSGLQDFRSSSSYLTVLFRSDHSVVARGFKASFSSSLSSDTARVMCSSDHMTIEIRRSYLDSLGISWHNLYVDDHRCRPSANSYEVSFNFPVDQCGTSKKFNNGRVIYNNHVRAAPSQSGEITRLIDQFLLNVTCHMEQDTTAGTVYKAKETINSTITGTGRFNATMSFYPSPSFSYPVLQHPYEVKLNQDLYIQVQLTRPDNTLDLFLDTCVASSNHNFDARTYTLIQNGCRQDTTVQIYSNGQHHYAQFSFKAFKFLRTHSFVFLQCRALICADNDYGSRCKRGCQNRSRRSLHSDHHTEVVTLGPITLKGARSAARVDVGK